jgi:hypothetical protein
MQVKLINGVPYITGVARNPIRYNERGQIQMLLGLTPKTQSRAQETTIDPDILDGIKDVGLRAETNHAGDNYNHIKQKTYATATIPKGHPLREVHGTRLLLHRHVCGLRKRDGLVVDHVVDKKRGFKGDGLLNVRAALQVLPRGKHSNVECSRRRAAR